MKNVPTYYLAHNFYTREKIRRWELRLEGRYNIDLDNPFYDNPERAEEMYVLDTFKDESRDQKAYLSTRVAIDIVEDDLEKIRKSDGLVAIANDTRIGTPMEIFYASRILRIPVYVITRKHATHPWIIVHATMIFSCRKEFEDYISLKLGVKK